MTASRAVVAPTAGPGRPAPAQALAWYRKSAEQGNVLAQNSLGDLLYQGCDVERDVDAARCWLRKAAARGNEMAKSNLRVLDAD